MTNRPFMNDPAPGWKRDLTGPNEVPIVHLNSVLSTPVPSILTEICMELPTSTLKGRGALAWPGLSMIVVSILLICMVANLSASEGPGLNTSSVLAALLASLIALWGGIYIFRMDIAGPRDEPIRFNRARRKVYAYHFKRDWKRPLSQSAWGIRTAVYDWDDLHAEACEVYGALGTGGFMQSIMLSVRRPGSRELLHRFMFSHSIYEGEQCWTLAQLFMQKGIKALPEFHGAMIDRNNASAPLNVFWCLAPKVQWPHELDVESRTAPESDDTDSKG